MTGIEIIEPRTSAVSRRTDADLDAAFAAARPRLLRIATGLVGSATAEDVVQDTYLTARDRFAQLRDPLALEGWLIRICVHRAFRVHRRARRLRELLDGLPNRARGSSVARATPLEVRELIETLGARERAVVVLQHGYGYSLLEVAELVGISHANARKIASRARATLLRAWQEDRA